MTEIFAGYSAYYDLLYEDKPYKAEAEYVSGLVSRFSTRDSAPISILDMACGTGRHCFELEAMGYNVEGSDASQQMVVRAEETASKLNSSVRFHNYSFQESHQIEKLFDVVISLFCSIGYLTNHLEIQTVFRNICTLLEPGGLFIFDYWNGNAVKNFSPVKVLQKSSPPNELIRISRTSLDTVKQLALVDFQFICLESGVKKHDFHELHTVRYFFFQEIEAYLDSCGFELLYRSCSMAESFSPDDWNITIVARKR